MGGEIDEAGEVELERQDSGVSEVSGDIGVSDCGRS